MDEHGRQVHAFALRMSNLGLTQVADTLLSMYRSGAWQQFTDGLGKYQFLAGEFDYFLTQQGVSREDVVTTVRDLDAKAELEAGMDERRTGEDGYRRPLEVARSSNPERPGNPIQPFGLRKSEAIQLSEEGLLAKPVTRLPLGATVRRFTNTGEARNPRSLLPRIERVRRAAVRLADDDLNALIHSLTEERASRRGAQESSSGTERRGGRRGGV